MELLENPVAALALGLLVIASCVAMICEGVLFFDPAVERRTPFLPYLAAARQPLASNRARVRATGIIASLFVLFFAAVLILLDSAA